MTSACRRTLLLAEVLLLTLAATSAHAAQPAVGLGTTASFAVLSGATVTNTGPSVINGDLGVSPGSAITGFPPGIVNGTMHATDAVASQAKSDLVTAYNDAAGRTPAALIPEDLGGLFLSAGAYQRAASLQLTGDVTLDGEGSPDAVFVIKVGSALTTASGSRVVLTGGAQACNVFWQIGSSATLGTDTTFRGNIFALESITANTRATLHGRALARNGAVTLDTNTVNRGDCAPGTTPGGGSTTPGGSSTPPAGPTTPGAPGTIDAVTGLLVPGTPPAATGPAGQSPAAGADASNGTALLAVTPREVAKTIARFGVTKCVKNSFRAVVSGLFIRKVTFLLDGHEVGTATKAPFAMRIRTDAGMHKLTARVSFTDGTRTRTLGFRWRKCEPASRRVAAAPAFTG
jgi:hypothetical protein